MDRIVQKVVFSPTGGLSATNLNKYQTKLNMSTASLQWEKPDTDHTVI